MADDPELCPWCQSTDIQWTMLASKRFACMSCGTCGARGPIVPFELKHEPIDVTTAPAIAAWSLRPSPVPIVSGEIVPLSVVRAFLDKYDECEPHITDAFVHRHLRCGDYTGPTYADEMLALRSAMLAASTPASTEMNREE